MSNDTNPSDQPCYVIMGATSGIARHLIGLLADDGANVLLAGRAADPLAELGEQTGFATTQVDATDIDAVEACFSDAAERFGRLDGAVNCAGSLLLKPAHLTSEDDWRDTIEKNLTTAFATVRAAGKVMRREGGSVVLLSSAAARIGVSGHEAIAAAKAGVIGLTLAAAATYAPSGIRFNAIAPGLTKTPMTKSIWSKEASAAASEEMHALGRLGEPSDIASAIRWLLHPSTTWITGEVISVDGGLSHVKPATRRKSA